MTARDAEQWLFRKAGQSFASASLIVAVLLSVSMARDPEAGPQRQLAALLTETNRGRSGDVDVAAHGYGSEQETIMLSPSDVDEDVARYAPHMLAGPDTPATNHVRESEAAGVACGIQAGEGQPLGPKGNQNPSARSGGSNHEPPASQLPTAGGSPTPPAPNPAPSSSTLAAAGDAVPTEDPAAVSAPEDAGEGACAPMPRNYDALVEYWLEHCRSADGTRRANLVDAGLAIDRLIAAQQRRSVLPLTEGVTAFAVIARYENSGREDKPGAAGERGMLQIHPCHSSTMAGLGLCFRDPDDRLDFAFRMAEAKWKLLPEGYASLTPREQADLWWSCFSPWSVTWNKHAGEVRSDFNKLIEAASPALDSGAPVQRQDAAATATGFPSGTGGSDATQLPNDDDFLPVDPAQDDLDAVDGPFAEEGPQ